MTERFDGLAQQTSTGASGVGPTEPVTTLTNVGVGQGSGQPAGSQENNSMIAFEFPIRWNDISSNLGALNDKKALDQVVDDLTVRDNLLEDFLNTNLVSGIVGGTNIAIDRATGVVTISTTATPIPPGTIMQYGGSTAPTGWLLCDGSPVSRDTYDALFDILGTTYGSGDGSTTFNLPNLKGRVPVGRDSTQTEFDVLGETGGSKTNTIGTTNLPAHKHTINHDHASFNTASGGSHQHGVPYGFYKTLNAADDLLAAPDGAGTLYYDTKSGDGAHVHAIDVPNFTGDSGDGPGTSTAMNNLQPYIVLNYIIKP